MTAAIIRFGIEPHNRLVGYLARKKWVSDFQKAEKGSNKSIWLMRQREKPEITAHSATMSLSFRISTKTSGKIGHNVELLYFFPPPSKHIKGKRNLPFIPFFATLFAYYSFYTRELPKFYPSC